MRRLFVPLSLYALFMVSSAVSTQAEDFLPAEKAFNYVVSVENNRILVSWIVTPGYYLYRKRMGFESATPSITLGETLYPPGEKHHDEEVGDDEIYRDTATFELPFKVKGQRPAEITLRLKWQGCADAGLCYPPATWETSVKLPPLKAKAPIKAAELDNAPLAASTAHLSATNIKLGSTF